MHNYSDDKILSELKKKRGHGINYLYEEFFSLARSIVLKNSGTYEDAEDLFHDGLFVLLEKVQKEPFSLKCSLKTYFFSICRNIWLQRLDRKWRLLYQPDLVNESVGDYDPFPFEIDEENLEKERLYNHHLFSLPEDCKKILMMFLSKISLKEITGQMGFKDITYTKTRKFLCKNMLRKRIINDPNYKTFFGYEQ
jgi:RNA polymerase sigma factor (sigma-70 family)